MIEMYRIELCLAFVHRKTKWIEMCCLFWVVHLRGIFGRFYNVWEWTLCRAFFYTVSFFLTCSLLCCFLNCFASYSLKFMNMLNLMPWTMMTFNALAFLSRERKNHEHYHKNVKNLIFRSYDNLTSFKDELKWLISNNKLCSFSVQSMWCWY